MMRCAIVGLIGLLIGMSWGRWLAERSLTIDPDEDGVTGAHKIGAGFWYLVPESLWVRLAAARHNLPDRGKAE